MNVKNIAYYWTEGNNIDNILAEGISVSGGIHANAVYLSVDAKQFYNRGGRNSLFLVDLRGIEKQTKLFPEKKWLLSLGNVPSKNIHYVGSDFEDEQELEARLHQEKTEFNQQFYRAKYPLRKDQLKPFTSQAEQKTYQANLVSQHF
ncbi:MAG: hypothetical protein KC535_03395 [Nanoarchaeota archaeon]|nr:hypothetical protein [Nanoarchaeota archaeon]